MMLLLVCMHALEHITDLRSPMLRPESQMR